MSPSMSESDSSIVEDNMTDEEDEEDVADIKANGKPGKRKMSRAARLAAEAMESPANARRKKGKPLSKLTYDDVKLTEADIKEDLQVVWKAMYVFLWPMCAGTQAYEVQASVHELSHD